MDHAPILHIVSPLRHVSPFDVSTAADARQLTYQVQHERLNRMRVAEGWLAIGVEVASDIARSLSA